jgi:hypothetical protein
MLFGFYNLSLAYQSSKKISNSSKMLEFLNILYKKFKTNHQAAFAMPP